MMLVDPGSSTDNQFLSEIEYSGKKYYFEYPISKVAAKLMVGRHLEWVKA